MKKVQWDKKLKKQLAFLPKDEREKIVAYYDELYYDKRDAGIAEEEILREFGQFIHLGFFGRAAGSKRKANKQNRKNNKNFFHNKTSGKTVE